VNAHAVLDLGPFWHAGITVDDLEGAMEHLSSRTGCGWGAPRHFQARLWHAEGGEADVDLRYTYSTGPEPRLELVCAQAGPFWSGTPRGVIDHLSYWVDDVSAASAALTAAGLPLVLTYGSGEEATGVAYHEGLLPHCRIELLPSTTRAATEAWLRGETA
jgi:hypothetical protein